MEEAQRHPFLKGLSKHRGAPPTVIVIFGASGDLTSRKLIPAVYNLGVDNLLPADFFLVGYGRKPIPEDEYREHARSSVEEFSRRSLNAEIWDRLGGQISYQPGGYDDLEAFKHLADRLDALEKEVGRDLQLLFYISTPPQVFEPILENLGCSGLARRKIDTPLFTKVIVEKPFGKDLDTAQHLNRVILQQFEEKQVYRIDHYLGKETVQDLLVHRFANAIFEPIWNREYVDCVQITVAESIGVTLLAVLLSVDTVRWYSMVCSTFPKTSYTVSRTAPVLDVSGVNSRTARPPLSYA